jgi:bacteriocin biosynthesis cyclodehydratase domain-containing protein
VRHSEELASRNLETLVSKLRFLPVQVIESEEGLILKRATTEVIIGGEQGKEVVTTLLDQFARGDLSQEEVCGAFAAPDRPSVVHLLEQLQARRLVVPAGAKPPADDSGESSLDVFYWQFGVEADRAAERFNDQHLAILGVNSISRQLAFALAAAGANNIEVIDYPLLRNLHYFDEDGAVLTAQWPEPLPPPSDFKEWSAGPSVDRLTCLIATSDFGGLTQMRFWNEFCVQNRVHFFPVVLQDMTGYVGPLIVPGQTACFECLRARQNSHFPNPQTKRASEAAAFEGQNVVGIHPSMASVLGDVAAIELTRFYSRALPFARPGVLVEVNLLATRMQARKILKLPRCPVCSPLMQRSQTASTKGYFPGWGEGK